MRYYGVLNYGEGRMQYAPTGRIDSRFHGNDIYESGNEIKGNGNNKKIGIAASLHSSQCGEETFFAPNEVRENSYEDYLKQTVTYFIKKDEPTLLFLPTKKDTRKWAGWLAGQIDAPRAEGAIAELSRLEETGLGRSYVRVLLRERYDNKKCLEELWEDETDAICTRISYHFSKIRSTIIEDIGKNKKNKEKVKNVFKVISRRGIMLNLAKNKLNII